MNKDEREKAARQIRYDADRRMSGESVSQHIARRKLMRRAANKVETPSAGEAFAEWGDTLRADADTAAARRKMREFLIQHGWRYVRSSGGPAGRWHYQGDPLGYSLEDAHRREQIRQMTPQPTLADAEAALEAQKTREAAERNDAEKRAADAHKRNWLLEHGWTSSDGDNWQRPGRPGWPWTLDDAYAEQVLGDEPQSLTDQVRNICERNGLKVTSGKPSGESVSDHWHGNANREWFGSAPYLLEPYSIVMTGVPGRWTIVNRTGQQMESQRKPWIGTKDEAEALVDWLTK